MNIFSVLTEGQKSENIVQGYVDLPEGRVRNERRLPTIIYGIWGVFVLVPILRDYIMRPLFQL
uniref:Uncharacterized protein n=1 Tax=Geoglobus ahangari TaxID=113653 RepID=A0A7C3YFY2_9EURY